MEEVSYLVTMRTSPQTYWHLRIDGVNPCDPPCYLTINQSENRAQADHTPWDPVPQLAFKNTSLGLPWWCSG